MLSYGLIRIWWKHIQLQLHSESMVLRANIMDVVAECRNSEFLIISLMYREDKVYQIFLISHSVQILLSAKDYVL